MKEHFCVTFLNYKCKGGPLLSDMHMLIDDNWKMGDKKSEYENNTNSNLR